MGSFGLNGRADWRQRREQELTARYRHTQISRHRGRIPDAPALGAGADYHYTNTSDFYYSAELAREMDRVDPILGAALTRVCDNLIQGGFRFVAQTGVPAVDDYLESKWNRWVGDKDRCDAACRMTHAEATHLAVRSVLRDGDIFKVPRADNKRAWLEYHRCHTPYEDVSNQQVVHGVEVDDDGKPIRYYFTEADSPKRATRKISVQPVEARNALGWEQVWHLYHPRRFHQNRGVTVVAPISDYLGMHDDIQWAKLVQQQNVSAIALLHEFSEHFSPPKPGEDTDQYITSQSGTWNKLRQLSGGLEYFGKVGEKVTGFSPNVPNPEYFRHVMLVLSIIAVNLGIPVQVLMLDPTATNFSGWRGAIDQARIGLRVLQDWIRTAHYCPDYVWSLRQWIATDQQLQDILFRERFDFGDPWGARNEWVYQHDFQPPKWHYIQPVEDITADSMELASHLTSPRQKHAERGRNFYSIVDETVEDNEYGVEAAKAAAQRINQKFADDDDPVRWRELWSPVTAERVSYNVQAQHPIGMETNTQQQVTADESV